MVTLERSMLGSACEEVLNEYYPLNFELSQLALNGSVDDRCRKLPNLIRTLFELGHKQGMMDAFSKENIQKKFEEVVGVGGKHDYTMNSELARAYQVILEYTK